MRFYIPNLLTVSRIVIAPFIFLSIAANKWVLASILFAFGGLTDVLDGYIARWLAVESPLGAYLDPVADKIFLVTSFTALFVYAPVQFVPQWFVIFLVIREVALVLGGAVVFLWCKKRNISAENVLTPSLWGKATTVFQSFFFAMVCFVYIVSIVNGDLAYSITYSVKNVAFPAVAVITIYSFISYAMRAIGFLLRSRK